LAAAQQKLAATEKWYRKFFIESLEKELKPHGLAAYDEIAISTPTERGVKSKFPDIVVVDPKSVTESHGSIVAKSDGIKAVIETKQPKHNVDMGLFQAIQYMNKLKCKYGFATNFKEMIAVTLGDAPTIDKETAGEENSPETMGRLAKLIAEIITGKRPLTAVEQNDKVIVDILRGAVGEILDYADRIKPSLLEKPLGFFLAQSFDTKLTAAAKNKAMKEAAAYLVLNQIVFYNLLASETEWFDKLQSVKSTKELQQYFDTVCDKDWKAVFQTRVAPLLDSDSVTSLNRIVEAVTHLKFERIKYDVLGKIFHELIPFEIRKRIAAYYTSNSASEMLARLAIGDWRTTVLDPSCGSGTLLVGAYGRKRELAAGKGSPSAVHKKMLEDIYGVDITPFAAHLAVVHLSLQQLLAETDDVKVTVSDAFALKPFGSVEFLGGNVLQTKMTADGVKPGTFKIPQVDVVIQNPPFTRGERLEENYKKYLERSMTHVAPKYIGKARVGLHCYFILHAADFLKKGGVYAAVLPEAVFVADYAKGIRQFLLDNFKIKYFITSESKTTFSEGCDFKEVLFVAEKDKTTQQEDWTAKFVILKTDLSLANAAEIAAQMEQAGKDCENSNFEMRLVRRSQLAKERNWMTLTKPQALLFLTDVIGKSPHVTKGKYVLVPSEGMHLDSEYFFIPNDDWELKKAEKESVTVKNTVSGETVKIGAKFLHLSLRRPELHTVITPKLEHYMLLVPPTRKQELPAGLQRYLDWAEMKGANKKQTIADYSRRKGLPWFAYMWDQVHHARTKATGRIAFVEKFRIKHRSCIAHYFDFNVLGTNSYFFGSTATPTSDKVLAAWFNSSAFLALFLHSRREIAGDWGRIKIHDLEETPCINPKTLSPEATDKIGRILDEMRTEQLPPIPDQLGKSPTRELDMAVVEALEIPQGEIFLTQLYSTLKAQIERLY
jgi:type I restriction-modification system DNA methylase subunit